MARRLLWSRERTLDGAMIKLAPNLETFVLRSSPTNVLEIDVGGVRGGHLPKKYPVPEYLKYLRRALA